MWNASWQNSIAPSNGLNQRSVPRVGLFYFVEGKLWIDATPLAEAGSYGDFRIHEPGHLGDWNELVSRGVVPDAEYEVFSRGRVVYHTKTGQYTLYADPCVLRRKELVRRIIRKMGLPKDHTRTRTDDPYRCQRCLSCGPCLVLTGKDPAECRACLYSASA